MNTDQLSRHSLPLEGSEWLNSTGSASKNYMTDIIFEFIPEEIGSLTPEMISAQVFSSLTNGEYLDLDKCSSSLWRCRSALELTSDSITLIVGWDETENGGCLQLEKAELEKSVATTGSNQIQRELRITETGGPVVKLAFEYTTIPPDEDTDRQDGRDLILYTMSEDQAQYIFSTVFRLVEGRPNESLLLTDYGNASIARFHQTENENDLNRSIQAYNRAARLRRIDDPGSIQCLRSAGAALLERYLLKGDPSDMVDAFSHFEAAINASSDGDEQTHMLLYNIELMFDSRFDNAGGLTNLCKVILLRQKAIRLLPEDHPTMHNRLHHLAKSLSGRFKLTNDIADISEAISYQQWLVNLTSEDHSDKHRRLANLASLFLDRFNRVGGLDDVSAAISSQQTAIQLIADDHEDISNLTVELALSFLCRFQCIGDLTDISNAISYYQNSIHLFPEGHPETPFRLTNLGIALASRFELTGNIADIHEAIACNQEALRLISSSPNNERMHILLCNAGSALTILFTTTGNLTTISDAISHLQRAVHLIPQGHRSRPRSLISLGYAYQCRFSHTRDIRDISEAISFIQEAIDLTPRDHPDLFIGLINLGVTFLTRFKVTNDLSDTSKAISAFKNAMDNTLQTDPRMYRLLLNLGTAYQARFTSTGDIDDINNSISFCRKSVQITPDREPRRYVPLCILGFSLHECFGLTKDPSVISEAILSLEKGFQLIPQGHPEVPQTLVGLGSCFLSRFDRHGNSTDIEEAISKYCLGATCSSGRPSQRFIAAKAWIDCCQKFNHPQLLDAYSTAIQLFSIIAGLEQTIQERHTKLLDISNLVSAAAATACNTGRYDLAIEWLELGRCHVWSQLNNLRTPVDHLRSHNSVLADDIVRVARALESAGSRAEDRSNIPSSMPEKISLQEEVTAHNKLSKEWDQLLEKVRAIPSFEDFLQPPSCSTLLEHLPDSGAVVVINIHEVRCDALALLSGNDEPLHIPLPKFSYSKANDLRKSLKAHLHACSLRMREAETNMRAIRFVGSGGAAIKGILGELWALVVKPILDDLGYQLDSEALPNSKLSRIWWCATGPLAFLPIHAAGIYESTSKTVSTLSDLAISSYIPTIRALVDRVKNPREVDAKKNGLFMISQPDTPHHSPIPGTTAEVRAIEQLMKAPENDNLRVHCLESAAATVDKAIMNMETYNCIHFACHASQNTSDALKSGFALYDGLLDLASITRKRLVGADLAFLSACQTSTGDEKLSEEAVHLAAGMLAAGYRGVVATMWSISDNYAPGIARDFYSSLIEGQDGLNSDKAAWALHCAVQKLRKTTGDSEWGLLTWVPYVHFGL